MNGLSEQEVAERIRAGQSNAPVEAPFKSTWQIIKTNTFTYFNAVFLGLAIILLAVGSFRDITFLPLIIINTLIGIVQEFRAKAVLEKLTVLNAQQVLVWRDKKKQTIPTTDLVIDDIAIFRAGDQISADATVLDGSAYVNESLLTGEPDEIEKTAESNLLSGSFVVSGECTARITKVGAESYAAKLTLQAKAIKTGEQSEIIRSLNKIVKMAGIAIIPIGALLFSRQFFLHGASVQASVQGMAAAVIGMIPEGLFLLASVSLAISAIKMARQEVLIHEMKSVETLAHVDVFCVDKTGTITSPEMNVREIVSPDKGKIDPNISRIISIFAYSSVTTNATSEAIQKYCTKEKGKATKFIEFSSKYKYSAAEIDGKKYVLGAPEFVAKDDYDEIKAKVESYSEKGYRVLAFGEYHGKLTGKELTATFTPLAFIILENPVRETAPETFKYFEEQGVRIVVISGDNPVTVSEVARAAQISGAENYIDATTLETDKDYKEAVKKYTVFGRVLPEQKRKLVQALQAQKHTVAMTGDGVNDVLALKDADCSIAMSSGADAAVQAAQLVLLDSDFSHMPSVVREGRRVVNNLERSGSLFIVKNIFSAIAAVLSIIIGFSYPLLPAQVSFVTMWVIGVPSFLLSQMPNEDLIHGHFINNILRKATAGGLANVILILATNGFLHLLNVEADYIPTICTIVFATVGIIYLLRICLPFDAYRLIVWTTCIAGLAACFIVLPWFFYLRSDLPFEFIELSIIIGSLSFPLMIMLDKVAAKFWDKHQFKTN
ncbi:HAD-IC family P-type ATPase [Candidatus Saccharibacteria bacterium]|nr:HAD-IC family P-type ATPase [Candidatus Saccharibacteria bacterium]